MRQTLLAFDSVEEANKVIYEAMESIIQNTVWGGECGSVHDFVLEANKIREMRHHPMDIKNLQINKINNYPAKDAISNASHMTKAEQRKKDRILKDIKRELENKPCVMLLNCTNSDYDYIAWIVDEIPSKYKY